MASKKNYNFGEKEKEGELAVWKSPKYEEAKRKAIEAIESDLYKGVLSESDFWILMNKTKTGKMAYTGLIISHNGCLKINDSLPDEKKFKPEFVTIDKEGYKGSLVYSYCNPDQGLYEVGEVSANNCLNSYPYAMALKRLMDRVILKNSRLAYAGIYSDSEADEIKNEPKEPAPSKVGRAEFVEYCNSKGIDIIQVSQMYKLNNGSKPEEFMNALAALKEQYK